MRVNNMPNEPFEVWVNQPCSSAVPLLSPGNEALGQRLARAKARLDRIRQDSGSRDLSELDAARVEFAMAAQALADDLIARGLGTVEQDA